MRLTLTDVSDLAIKEARVAKRSDCDHQAKISDVSRSRKVSTDLDQQKAVGRKKKYFGDRNL